MSHKNFNRKTSFQDSVFVDMFSRVVPHKTYFTIYKKKQSKPRFQNINALLGPSHRTVLCWLLREAWMTISLYFWILKILLWGQVSRWCVFGTGTNSASVTDDPMSDPITWTVSSNLSVFLHFWLMISLLDFTRDFKEKIRTRQCRLFWSIPASVFNWNLES